MRTQRRKLLDSFLRSADPYLTGKRILDVGGTKVNKRGNYLPPHHKVLRWDYLNNNIKTEPDILAELPIIPCKNASYDVVILCEVIEYVYDYHHLFTEIHRVLDKGGLILITAPLHHEIHGDFEHDYYRLTKSFYKVSLPAAGFAVDDIKPMGGLRDVLLDFIRHENIFVRTLAKLAIFFVKNKSSKVTTGYFIVCRKSID